VWARYTTALSLPWSAVYVFQFMGQEDKTHDK